MTDNQGTADLLRRLDLLEAEREIRAVMDGYGHALDYGRPDEFAALFARDGVFDVFYADGRRMHRDQGKQALAAYVSAQTRAPIKFEKHIYHSPQIAIRGEEARVESLFTALRDEGSGPVVHVFGKYTDRFVKEDGHWRIKERVAVVESLRQRK